MRDAAAIVIVGSGAVDCSIAYHLAELGKREVLLLEKSGLTHSVTWHAAGVIGQLKAETGQATDWTPVGSPRLASSEARWKEVRCTATTARSLGFELHPLDPKEAALKLPPLGPKGLIGAAFIPSGGYIDPGSLTQALAKGAWQGRVEMSGLSRGVKFVLTVVTFLEVPLASPAAGSGALVTERVSATATRCLPTTAISLPPSRAVVGRSRRLRRRSAERQPRRQVRRTRATKRRGA